jgi:hypothetical protein
VNAQVDLQWAYEMNLTQLKLMKLKIILKALKNCQKK